MEHVQPQTQVLSDKQREAFARLIADAKKQAQAKAEDDSDLKDRIEKELAPQIAKERGALALVKKIRLLRTKLEVLEKALSKIGFTCDEDSIDTAYDAPKGFDKAVETAVTAARKERDAEFQKFERAILRVWTVDTVAEAREIVEGLL